MRSIDSAEARHHGGIRPTTPGAGGKAQTIGARVTALARLAAAIHMAQAADARRASGVVTRPEGDRR
jgi:hypothetical protein